VRRKVVILGSTGSIGGSTLEVLERHEESFEVVGLVAGRRVERLAEQVRRWQPSAVSVADDEAAARLREHLGPDAPQVLSGPDGAASVTVDTGPDLVVAAIVGAAGLVPTLAAVRAGCVVALANKEALVVAGELMVHEAQKSGAVLLPVDSEHNAIHQCLRAGRMPEVQRVVLTASGGPFRGRSAAELASVSTADALDHPTWSMGRKITIDSATLMNKGLEVIEARWLFGMPAAAIDVVIHPQSVVHSLVEYRDGSILAQLGTPDMRHPIQYALTWPERWSAPSERLDLPAIGALTFEEPDREAFPCLDLAYGALDDGGDAPARLNAANEEAVAAFLDGGIGFNDIPAVIESVLAAEAVTTPGDVAGLIDADRRARRSAREVIARELSRR